MRVKVLLFGPEASLAGRESVDVELGDGGGATCAEVVRGLGEACPALAGSLRSARLAVNHAFVDAEHRVRAGDEVALIGPVSGG